MATANDERSELQIFGFAQAFSEADINRDGTITPRRLGIAMRSLGYMPTMGELQARFNEVDDEGHGCIDFSKFVFLMTRKLHELYENAYEDNACNDDGEDSLPLSLQLA